MSKKYLIDHLQTPYYIIDQELLKNNLSLLQQVTQKTGCKILLAQKAFSMFALYPLIRQYLHGTASSGLFEAKLSHNKMKKENHIYSPAYTEKDFPEIVSYCSHIIFNSFYQWQKFGPQALKAGKSCGLRINPEHSTQKHAIYDPCSPGSRLGITKKHFQPRLLQGIEGLHFHTLCEQNAADLIETVEAVEEKFGTYFHRMKWLNLGGGHHITHQDYDLFALEQCLKRLRDQYQLQIYLEPGEAVALNSGFLVTSVIDLVENELQNAILDTSAACHMPDVLEMPYRPPLLTADLPGEKEYTYRLGGPTCLAGDIIGDYSFDEPLKRNNKLIFTDMAIYSMVKNNTFNGINLPAIVLLKTNGQAEVIKQFTYENFKNRLS
ncbi:MAG: carboxynorspermidine decarboxylase [Bacillota bacterium]|jgi:carboxynorspermidine decarboxylase